MIMVKPSETTCRDDSYDLNRFTKAQRNIYDKVLSELKNGKIKSYQIQYIFPQIGGLGHSPSSEHYAIKSIEEARQYLDHPVLGKRLLHCVEIILANNERSILEIFSSPDHLKFKSSMTLFACIANRSLLFARVLDKYFNCERDAITLQLFEKIREK
jgi:uncharacterized protein (DUF1810 family)